MCTYRLVFGEVEREFGIVFATRFPGAMDRLRTAADDGLVTLTADGFELTSWGRIFVRNVCMAFDAYLGSSENPSTQRFSRTV
jgi:oxygen-independent coproporphyrinogen-3 oxidase